MKRAILAFVLAVVAGVASASAQEQDPVLGPQFEQRYDELAAWLREYHEWEDWFAKWGNRIARNFNDNLIWERKKRPEPPAWLAQECLGYIGVDGLLASACSILRDWDDQPLHIVQRRRPSLVTSGGKIDDKVEKTSFFQRVHLTGLWLRARYPATPIYGVVGMQVGVFEVGRFTLPAVGVLVVMIPDGEGGYDWKPATTLGFGYRICNFVTPVIKKQASLHFNIARTSIHGTQDERIVPGATTLNFFGLSVSAGRRR
jgi:hypothetical protein